MDPLVMGPGPNEAVRAAEAFGGGPHNLRKKENMSSAQPQMTPLGFANEREPALNSARTLSEFQRFLKQAQQQLERAEDPASLRTWQQLAESWRITQALRECKGNRSAAARRLGIGRRTLYAKMERLEITPSALARVEQANVPSLECVVPAGEPLPPVTIIIIKFLL